MCRPERIDFMNLKIDNITMEEALSVVKHCIDHQNKMYIVTPNVDHVVKLQKDMRFQEAYKKAGLVAVDGTPIVVTAKLYGTPLKEKITGPRLTERIVQMAAQHKYSVFILGAGPGVAEMAGEKLLKKYPEFCFAGSYSPAFGFEKDEAERKKIIDVINRAKPDIVIAGMGSPKTEIFLSEIYESLDVSVSMSVGAAIDFFAETVRRCPVWINKIGMEWLYRFSKEPKRMFKRYFVDDIQFLSLMIKYKNKR